MDSCVFVAEEEELQLTANATLCLVLKKGLYWNRTASNPAR